MSAFVKLPGVEVTVVRCSHGGVGCYVGSYTWDGAADRIDWFGSPERVTVVTLPETERVSPAPAEEFCCPMCGVSTREVLRPD